MVDEKYWRRKAYLDWCAFQTLRNRLSSLVPGLREKRMLDEGCGVEFPQTLLFHTFGYNICGIDVSVPDLFANGSIPSNWGWHQRSVTRESHLQRYGAYYRELGHLAGQELIFNGVDIRPMDMEALSFEDESIDVVISHAVMEHIARPAKALDEIKRVLVPSGRGWIGIHLFPSLSGGHHPEWQNPAETLRRTIPPWDHLRGNRFQEKHIHLNKLRLKEWKRLFYDRFNVLEETEEKEEGAERYLAAEIEKELKEKGYDREELLTKWVTFVVKKSIVHGFKGVEP